MTGDPTGRVREALWARLLDAVPPEHPAWAKAPEPCPATDLSPIPIAPWNRAASRSASLLNNSYPQRALVGAPTPKEAPMPPVPSPYTDSAPFTHVDKGGDELILHRDNAYPGVYLLGSDCGNYIADEDAPAVALAILQAAGIRGTHVWTATSVESAVAFLTLHVEAEARKKADAEKAAAAEADAAKLDEEAQALRAAQLGDSHGYAPWVHISLGMKRQYRAAARKARELHGKA